MKKINILPENLVNKIAAGEVVERPSSVIKELVENSLDAQSTRIIIEIEQGGTKLIKISDNGEGIARESLPLAMKRHATSKLTALSELQSLESLGFRGEALPSIASVSLFEIISKTKDQLSGYRLKIEGGKIKEEAEIGAPDGTSIEVRELFFNTPARRKFLKSQVTETRHIIETINGLALAFPSCGFELISEARSLFAFKATLHYPERVRDVLGSNDFSNLLDFEEESDLLRIQGFTIKPEFALKNRAQVFFLVNRRRITSPLLYSALMTAYGEFLPKGRYPQAVIYLYVNPEILDVNVSPTKSEVRFAEERSIFQILMLTIKKTLSRGTVIPHLLASPQTEDRVIPNAQVEDYKQRVRQAAEKFFEDQKKPSHRQQELNIPPRSYSSAARPEESVGEPKQVKSYGDASAEDARGTSMTILGPTPYKVEQFADLFIIAYSKDRLTIIDQHAAHERILYEEALRSFDHHKMTAQKLLIPVNVEMESGMLAMAEEYFEILSSLGFELERFGPRAIVVHGIPAVAGDKNPETLVMDLLLDLCEFRGEAQDRFKIAAQKFACRAAIKSGERLSDEMMKGLVRALFRTSNPYVCPHGRPTVINLTVEDLKARFGR